MTSQDKKKKHIRFSIEDRARITRLREEIIGRIEEMARINVRNLKITPQFPLKEVTFRSSGTMEAPDIVEADIQYTYSDGSKSCESVVAGVCCAGPCPC